MNNLIHFPIFILVSLLAFVALMQFALRHRAGSLHWKRLSGVAGVVVVGGMLFAKFGANLGVPWWIYYGVPALLALVLPPVTFGMNRRETAIYVLTTFGVSPLIHTFFSFFLGWKEYMPFLAIPYAGELLCQLVKGCA